MGVIPASCMQCVYVDTSKDSPQDGHLALPTLPAGSRSCCPQLGHETIACCLEPSSDFAAASTLFEGWRFEPWACMIEVGAFYWTDLAPDIVNSEREEQGSISV